MIKVTQSTGPPIQSIIDGESLLETVAGLYLNIFTCIHCTVICAFLIVICFSCRYLHAFTYYHSQKQAKLAMSN